MTHDTQKQRTTLKRNAFSVHFSFLEGMAHLFDFKNALNCVPKVYADGFITDRESLAGDWGATGNAVRQGMATYDKQSGTNSYTLSEALPNESQEHEVVPGGSIPPARELARYNQAHPNAADRIITMAEEEAIHRRTLQKQLLLGEQLKSFAGLFIGGSLIFYIARIGADLISEGKPVEGFASIIIAIGTVLTALYISIDKEGER